MQVAQQPVNVALSDPDNVKETYANGPFHISTMGPCSTLTFTNARVVKMLAGGQAEIATVVVGRITVPNEVAAEVAKVLTQHFGQNPGLKGPSGDLPRNGGTH